MTKITIKTTKLLSFSNDYDATLTALATSAITSGAIVEAISGNTIYEFDGGLLPLDVAKTIAPLVESMEDYATFIEIANTTDEVPLGVYGREYADEDGEVLVHTWETWKKDNHTFLELDERLFVGSNAHTDEYLSLADLEGVANDLLSESEIKALQALEEQVE